MRPSFRGGVLPAALLALACLTSEAGAVATVHRLNLVLSAVPTSVSSTDFNERVIGNVNRLVLAPRGLEELDSINWGWLFDTQLRYFVRNNVAVELGVGQLRTQTSREFLPALNASIQYRAEVLSVPVHAGGAYYLPGYNQGDFQARAYLGGGLMSLTYNHARFQAEEAGTDTSSTLGGTFLVTGRRDSPGYYLESGVHMFFAARYSVMIGVLYRSAVVRDMQIFRETRDTNGNVTRTSLGSLELDTGGVGGRFAVGIGF